VALAPAQLRTRICQVANRNLTPTEWATAVGAVSYRRVCPDLPEEPAGLSATPLHRPTSVPQPR
jgi:hypothetical protein